MRTTFRAKQPYADIILLTPNGDLPNTLFGDENAPLPVTLMKLMDETT